MGQEVRGVPEAAPLSGVGQDGAAIGQYLARQRRLRGISLEALSSRTKIPLRSLERLESGAFDRAPDGFVRGFVRAVADALGLDADDAVLRLLTEPPEEEDRERRDGARRRALVLAAAAALLLLLGGLAVWGVRSALAPEARTEADAGQVILRRDPVRALADDVAQGGAREGQGEPQAGEVNERKRPEGARSEPQAGEVNELDSTGGDAPD